MLGCRIVLAWVTSTLSFLCSSAGLTTKKVTPPIPRPAACNHPESISISSRQRQPIRKSQKPSSSRRPFNLPLGCSTVSNNRIPHPSNPFIHRHITQKQHPNNSPTASAQRHHSILFHHRLKWLPNPTPGPATAAP